jgi:4-aminobutyrate aminotransferase-like enzyme
MVNAFEPGNGAGLDPLVQSLIARRSRVLGPSYKLFYDHPLHAVRGEGVWLYDAAGDRYLDAYNNVPAVGHCHPHVVEAVSRQLATLNTHTRYLYDIVLTYAERLVASFPKKLANVMFTCTGSESSDLAMRIAASRPRSRRYRRLSAPVSRSRPTYAPLRRRTDIALAKGTSARSSPSRSIARSKICGAMASSRRR